MKRADETPKALFQRDDCRRYLILKEGVAAAGFDCLDPRCNHGIGGDCERKAVDDHAAELLALNIHPLPEGRGRNQHTMGRGAEFFKERTLWGVALQEHGKFHLAEQALIYVPHLGIAGEQHKSAAARDLQEPADSFCGLESKLRRAGFGKVGRDIKQGLILVIEVRRENYISSMIHAET